MALIDDLKKEHVALFALLDEVKKLGFSTEEGQKKLIQSKEMFLNHLRKEDKQLYPRLEELAETKTISKSFQSEMEEMSGSVLAFFNQYEKGIEANMAFAKDFGALVGNLNSRMRKEEIILYASYEKHIG